MQPPRLVVERLEDRTVPAFLASQLPTLPPLVLQANEVQTLLDRASVATASRDAIIAIVDRNGAILGVRVEDGVSTNITGPGNANMLNFAIDGAVSLARTGAYFSSDTAPLTSRTIQFISQSTITEREVDSYTFDSNPASTTGGPGFVAPIGLGGHFPPGVANTPQVDLFAIEHTNRDMLVNPGATGILDTPLFTDGGDVSLQNRFNIDPAFVPAGQDLTAPLSYADTILPPATVGPLITPGGQDDPTVPHVASRGIGTLPGGIPIYEDGVLIGGIGVFFPGATGFASEENSQLSADFDPTKADRSLEAEYIAFAAIGGSREAGFPVGTIAGIRALPGFNLAPVRIDLVGITLDGVGPGGSVEGPKNLIRYVSQNFVLSAANTTMATVLNGANQPVNFALVPLTIPGTPAPDGWLVTPHAGGNLTAAQVNQIIVQGINEADLTRSQLRPLEFTTRMVLSVTDSAGNVLGLYRMPDAPYFSINVAVSKARNVAYYNDPAQLQAIDQLPGIPTGAAFTARTFRFLALPRYPEGIDGKPPGFFSTLNDPGVSRADATTVGPAQTIAAFTSVLGFDAFHPGTNFHDFSANASGVVYFPGSSSVNTNNQIVGGFGVSGDGVDEDDVVTTGGIRTFEPANFLEIDKFYFRGVRLPYGKFDRNPRG